MAADEKHSKFDPDFDPIDDVQASEAPAEPAPSIADSLVKPPRDEAAESETLIDEPRADEPRADAPDQDGESDVAAALKAHEAKLTRLFQATVHGPGDERIGKVGQVYLDDQTRDPNWITVKTGFFGSKEFFIPLDLAQLDDKRIIVPYTKDQVTVAPSTEIDQNLSPAEEDALYVHYQVPGRMPANGTDTSLVAEDAELESRPGSAPVSYQSEDDLAATDEDAELAETVADSAFDTAVSQSAHDAAAPAVLADEDGATQLIPTAGPAAPATRDEALEESAEVEAGEDLFRRPQDDEPRDVR